MKQELDNLTTEESIAHSPEIASPSFKNNLARFSISNLRREELLVFTLKEAEQKLQAFQDQRRMIKGTLKEQTNIYMHRILQNREDISRIEKQLEKLEITSAQMQNAIKKQNQVKLESFRVALKPLQDVVEMINSNKLIIEKKVSDLDATLSSLLENESECMGKLTIKRSEEEEMTSQRDQLLTRLQELKKSNPWEYKECIEDRETKEFLLKTRESKSQKVAALNALDKLIADLSSQSEILSRDIESLKGSILSTEVLKKNERELKQLEEFLNLQCEAFNGPKLSQIIEELCIMRNFPINQMIFKEQFRLIEQQELILMETAKNQQEAYEAKITELNKAIEDIEVEIYALISVQQSDPSLEKHSKRVKKELEETREKIKKLSITHNSKIQALLKWKTDNRNILLITDNERIPTDEQVRDEFYERLKPYVENPEHWQAMESVILRYFDKARERETMQVSLLLQKQKDENLIEVKTEALKRVRAIKTSKESERSLIHKEFEKFVELEKKTLKNLESSKLEVESARKGNLKDAMQNSLKTSQSYTKFQKTYGDKAVKRMIEKESLELKNKVESERSMVKGQLEQLYKEKIAWDKNQDMLKKEITENFQSKLTEVQAEISKLQKEKTRLMKELQTLSEAEEEASTKINGLIENKRNELIHGAKKVANTHGGQRVEKIEQLYQLRNKKEAEIVDIESNLIKLEGGLSDKETVAELEIVKIKARILNINRELAEIENNKKQTEKLERTISKIDISASDFASDLELASDLQPSPTKLKEQKKEPSERPSLLPSSPFEFNKDITEDNKDNEEESNSKADKCYKDPPLSNIDDENQSDVSSEIPCPFEPQYKFDQTDLKNKAFFEAIVPLIEGTIIYKLFKTKHNNTFDPLEGRLYHPEDCGYGIRKMKLNRQLGKIEFRQVGKLGVESSIMVDQILSVVVPNITSEIIKARNKKLTDEEHTLEKSEEYNRIYRNMKQSGTINYNSEAFIYKSKENCFFPMVITLKSGRVELIAEGLVVYKSWLQGICLLVKNKANLEMLKYKITQI